MIGLPQHKSGVQDFLVYTLEVTLGCCFQYVND